MIAQSQRAFSMATAMAFPAVSFSKCPPHPHPHPHPHPLLPSLPNPQLFHSLSYPAKITLKNPSRSSSSSDNPKLKEESSFFDEDGVVQDMDAYLNYLSLEYDSIWDTKPSWCQPWTITLTGVLITTSSWLLLQSTVVTAVVFTLICAWWYIFLYSYPKAYSDMISERRKKVTSGLEDTYGERQSKEL